MGSVPDDERQLYEAAFDKVVGPDEETLDAGAAVVFLRKSGLEDAILHDIWARSDPDGNGYLDKDAFVVAMKLISLAQAELDLDTSLDTPTDRPVLDDFDWGEVEAAAAGGDWAITPEEKAKFDKVFSLLPQQSDGTISGPTAREVLLNSKLPTPVLGRIWECADIDGDGALDQDEFAVAMHLVYRCLDGEPAPSRLAPTLVPPSKRGGGAAGSGGGGGGGGEDDDGEVDAEEEAPEAQEREQQKSAEANGSDKDTASEGRGEAKANAATPTKKQQSAEPSASETSKEQSAGAGKGAGEPTQPHGNGLGAEATQESTKPTAETLAAAANTTWVVGPDEQKTYAPFFKVADKDKDGIVSGQEVLGIFLTSKLPRTDLAHVWNLCDIYETGTLNAEQFALAMHLISQKIKGVDFPSSLTPEMIPPSCRDPSLTAPPAVTSGAASGSSGAKPAVKKQPSTTSMSNKEVDEELANAKTELRQQRTKNSSLQKQVASTTQEAGAKRKELEEVRAQLQKLRSEERTLRQQLREGKAQVQGLVAQIREAQTQVGKVEDTNARLRQSQQKIERTLKEYGASPEVARSMRGTGRGNASATPSARSSSASMRVRPSSGAGSDPFSRGNARAKSQRPKSGVAVRDPFAPADPFSIPGASPWK